MGDTLDPDAEEGENGRRQFSEPGGEDREGKGRAPYVDVETIIVTCDQFDESTGIRWSPHHHELWHVCIDTVENRQAGQRTYRLADALIIKLSC